MGVRGALTPDDSSVVAPAPNPRPEVEVEVEVEGDREGSGPVAGHRRRRPDLVVAAAVGVGVVLPAVVALWVLRTPTWHPILDWAQAEGRVRDVGTAHTPLVSTPGRFVGLGAYGYHPGPVVFYAMAPVYRLTGSSSFSLMLATTVLNLAAVGAAVWVAFRRGGRPLALGMAALLAVLFHAVSAEHVVLPWNPWLTLWWWVVFLLAVWSVLCDDVWMLPVAAWAGSVCGQTHVSYVPMVGLVGVLLVGWLLAWRRHHPGPGAGESAGGSAGESAAEQAACYRRDLRRSALAAGGVLAVVWLPVVVDAVAHDPSNVAVLWDFFTSPGYTPVGWGAAAEVMTQHLDVVHLAAGTQQTSGVSIVGVAVLGAWAATVVVAVRARARDLVALHATVAAGLVANLAAASRITGQLWDYLVLWAWGTTALVLLAIGMTVARAAPRWLGSRAPAGDRRWPGAGAVGAVGSVALLAVAVTAGVASAAEATDARVPFQGQSRALDILAPQLVDGLEPDGRYVFTWDDAYANGMPTQGLVLDLQRAGFVAGTGAEQEYMVGEARTLDWDEATAVLAYVTGRDAIDRWRSRPGAVEVAHSEPSVEEVRNVQRLRRELMAGVVDAGHPELVGEFDASIWNFAVDDRVPDDLIPEVRELMDQAVPASVFLVPKA